MLKRLQNVKKEAFKFQFTISYQELILDCYNKWYPKSVYISWSRKDKNLTTKTHPVVADPDVSQRFLLTWPIPENQVAVVTLFRGSSSAFFEAKHWVFEVYEGDKLLGSQKINLSENASTIPKQLDLKLALSPCYCELKNATLHFTISSSLIKHGRATEDDGLSLGSFQSGGSRLRFDSGDEETPKLRSNMFRSFRVKKKKKHTPNAHVDVVNVTERYNLARHMDEYETSFGAERSNRKAQLRPTSPNSTLSSLSSLNPPSSLSSLPKPASSSSSSKPTLPTSPTTHPMDPTEELLSWCQSVTKNHILTTPLDNLTTAWRNGLAFCAIIHHFKPQLIDYDSLDPTDAANNCRIAFEAGESLGIPRVMEAQDMVLLKVPDKLSVMTYLFQLKSLFAPSSLPQASKKRLPSHFKFSFDQRSSPVHKPLRHSVHDGGSKVHHANGACEAGKALRDTHDGDTKVLKDTSRKIVGGADAVANASSELKTISETIALKITEDDLVEGKESTVPTTAIKPSTPSMPSMMTSPQSSTTPPYSSTPKATTKSHSSKIPSQPSTTTPKDSFTTPPDSFTTPPESFTTASQPGTQDTDTATATATSTHPSKSPSKHSPIPPSPSSSTRSPTPSTAMSTRQKLMTRKQLYNPFDSDSDDESHSNSLLEQPIPVADDVIAYSQDNSIIDQVNNNINQNNNRINKNNNINHNQSDTLQRNTDTTNGNDDHTSESNRHADDVAERSRRQMLRETARTLMSYAGRITSSPIGLFSKLTADVADEDRQQRLREQARKMIADAKNREAAASAKRKDSSECYFRESEEEDVNEANTRQQGGQTAEGGQNRSLYLQSEMAKVERDQRSVDEVAVKLEGVLRNAIEEGDKKSEVILLQEWFSLVDFKNALTRRQAQLEIEQDEDDLEKRFTFLSTELRSIMELSEWEKNDVVRKRERLLLAELVQIVDQRDQMVRMMDETEQAILIDQANHRGVQMKLRQEQQNCRVM